ncbi:TIGR03862 family flavoprotein [Phenylobacterium sp. LjRoot219]|uniref:NAD(P)/FAD-dependent oxidoreductase n=1 Tax=Phenylobacterium sp. LjRoot219 TaxID=3342283 RepID=UPI003ED071F2
MSVAVVGGGPAGLFAAETLSARGCRVTVYERMPTFGRKLLMAGRGGLNLTHSEPFARFKTRYGAASGRLDPYLDAFPSDALIAWAEGLGQPMFVGSSGRVFPKALKASPLLRAWLQRLTDQGVRLQPRAEWLGWDAARALRFRDLPAQRHDAVILALGGASWPKLGSTGAWAEVLAAQGVEVAPFRPANCGFVVDWSEAFRTRFAGAPLKSLALSFEGRSVRGEAMIAGYGIEGGGVYALSAALRDAIARDGRAVLQLDLRPDLTEDQLAAKLSPSRGSQSLSTFLRKATGLPPAAVNLIREANAGGLPENLAHAIKHVAVPLTATRGLERAISSAGGVSWSAVDETLMLTARPGVFVAGEMLDWEAPTGGYLLQACFATGLAAANGVAGWLANP